MPGPLHSGHEERVAAGVSFVWQDLPPLLESLDGLPRDIERLHFRRQRKSHRGIAELQHLKCLWARQANQEFIDEISLLENLEVLYVNGLTATSLAGLARNRKLKRLLLIGGTKVDSMEWAAGLPATLQVLFLEGFTRAPDIGPLGELAALVALGIEGGMDTHVRIATLKPLARLHDLRQLFLASTRVEDKSLAPLRGLTRLERLECTAHFPDAEFIALRDSLPNLECDWINLVPPPMGWFPAQCHSHQEPDNSADEKCG
jgi:hypothetical protein